MLLRVLLRIILSNSSMPSFHRWGNWVGGHAGFSPRPPSGSGRSWNKKFWDFLTPWVLTSRKEKNLLDIEDFPPRGKTKSLRIRNSIPLPINKWPNESGPCVSLGSAPLLGPGERGTRIYTSCQHLFGWRRVQEREKEGGKIEERQWMKSFREHSWEKAQEFLYKYVCVGTLYNGKNVNS